MNSSMRKTLGLASLLSLGIAAAQAEAASCSYSVVNSWNTGFQGSITITNNTTTAINGWNVGWTYSKNKITSSWNATLAGSNPYTATNLSWNGSIAPGQSVSFGVQGDLNGGAAEVPAITGAVCSTVVSSSSASSVSTSAASSANSSNDVISSSSKSSSSSSVASSTPSSVASSSSSSGFTQQCNWYGSLYPVCVTTTSGWGYEQGKSCISASTCSAQPAPYGIVGATSSTSSSVSSVASSVTTTSSSKSSVVSSIASSVATSSSSSVASSVVSSSSSSVVSSSSSSSSVVSGTRLDNPFVGATWYLNTEWQAKALAETGGSKIAYNNTAVWLDRIAAIQGVSGGMGLRDHLDAALSQKVNLVMFVVYDLPNRDCHALASNGELTQSAAGTARYRTEYIDPIASIFADSKYKDLRIIAIIEPDSLPNLVTNLDDPDCAAANVGVDGYVPNTQYTLNKLAPITNVYSYVDIGHSGWLGWDNNMSKATDFIATVIKGTTAGVNSVAGFVSNTANTTPLSEPFLDPFQNTGMPGNSGVQVRQAKFYEWNPHFGEISFVKAWRTAMIAKGFPSTIGMLIDTGRNGWGGVNRPKALSTSTDLETFVNSSRIDPRAHRGNWCNQKSGIGERPQTINSAGIDAYVWVKPPGESDGAASLELSYDPTDPAKGFDRMCDPTYTRSESSGTVETGAMAGAPVAGQWFSAGFQQLIKDAYPVLP